MAEANSAGVRHPGQLVDRLLRLYHRAVCSLYKKYACRHKCSWWCAKKRDFRAMACRVSAPLSWGKGLAIHALLCGPLSWG